LLAAGVLAAVCATGLPRLAGHSLSGRSLAGQGLADRGIRGQRPEKGSD
jgi:hypothetical protein